MNITKDPVRGQENMAKARAALDIPFATNMCTTSFEDIPGSVRLGSEDIILSDQLLGGLRASIELARICKTFSAQSLHALQQSPRRFRFLMAMAHLAVATPNSLMPVTPTIPGSRKR
ncbi:MAG: hypothetical protein R2932_20665 [Caldilineaceae bacterium]